MKKFYMAFLAGVLCASTGAYAQEGESHILKRLVNANVEHGETEFKKCLQCHTIGRNEGHGRGPNLWGVINREVASVEGYEFSDSFKQIEGRWTVEKLDDYLEDPRAHAGETNMRFVGIKRPSQRANLIAYLNTQSDEMLNFSALAEDIDEADAPKPSDSDEYGELHIAEGVEETHAYCTACHSEMIVAQQGLDRQGWINMLEWMVEEQGMSEIEEPDYSTIIDYLTKHYNTDRPNFPR